MSFEEILAENGGKEALSNVFDRDSFLQSPAEPTTPQDMMSRVAPAVPSASPVGVGEQLAEGMQISPEQMTPELQKQALEAAGAYQPEKQLDKAVGLTQNVLQGMTAGFSDELQGGIRGAGYALGAAITGKEGVGEAFSRGYGEATKEARDETKKFAEENPMTAMGAQLAGGLIAPGGAAAKGIGAAKGLAGKALAGAAAGGAGGFVGGVGGAEGGIGERLKAGGTGAITGALMGGAMPVAGSALKGAGKVIGGIFTGKSADDVLKGTGRVNELASKYKKIMQKAKAEGREVSLADLDSGVAGLGRTIRKGGGKAQQAVEEGIEKRIKGESDRIADVLTREASGGKGYLSGLDDIVKVRKAAAKPIYDMTLTDEVIENKELNELLKIPIFQDTLPAIKEVARTTGEAIPDDLLTNPTMKNIDLIKRGLDEIISGETDKVTNKVSVIGKNVIGLKNDMLDIADKQNPLYKQARKIYSDSYSVERAMKEGFNFDKMSPEAIERARAKLSGAELDGWEGSVVNKLKDNVLKTTDMGSSANKIVGQLYKQKQLKAAFGEKKFNKVMKSLKDEINASKAYKKIMGGSQSDINLAEGDQINSVVNTMRGGIRGLADATLGKAVNIIERSYRGLNRKNSILLAKAIVDPKESLKMITKIANKSSKKQLQSVQNIMTNILNSRNVGAAVGQQVGRGMAPEQPSAPQQPQALQQPQQ